MIEVRYQSYGGKSLFLQTTRQERDANNLRWQDLYEDSLGELLSLLKSYSYKVQYIKDSRGNTIILD